ncbi:NAD(P)H-quinone oxidoreductase subunit M [Prochlorococcus marinus]|uniref:NAD(P)H-quinone oxidoreductase subunit M n=1 Tax=Prochlorococcus marinus TaxID=1219 RepID=UPI0039AFFDAE
MSDTILKCTTRHVRIFTAVVENDDLILDNDNLTLDIDPDNEFLWDDDSIRKVQDYFRELVDSQEGNELSDYSLRKIGSLLEDFIRKLLKEGELSYNPNSRVINYSMGLPRTQELL